MTEEAKICWAPPTGSDDELRQPTVVVNMPEVAAIVARRKRHGLLRTLAVASAFILLAILIVLELVKTEPGVQVDGDIKSEIITLTVNVTPVDASVKLDGKPLPGTPPSIEMEVTDRFHSIQVMAAGYETLTRDVKLGASQSIKVRLRRIDTGEGSPTSTDPQNAPAEDEIIFEQEMEEPASAALRRPRPVTVNAGGTQPASKPTVEAAPAPQATPVDDWGNPIPTETAPAAAAAPAPDVPATATVKPVPSVRGTTPVNPAPAALPAPRAPAASAAPAPVAPAPVEEDPYENNVPGGTLVITAPAGSAGAVAVYVDKKKYGNAPVTIELVRGLHEVVFITNGNRTFRMVNIRSGERKVMEAISQ